MKTTKTIQIKRGTGTTLSTTQKSHVLQEGEPFYHSGAEFVTIGNGDDQISDLPRIGTGTDISLISAGNVSSIQVNGGTIRVGDSGHIVVDNDKYLMGDNISFNGNVIVGIGKGLTLNSNALVVIGNSSGTDDSPSDETIAIGSNATARGGNRDVMDAGVSGSVPADNQIVIGTNAVGNHRDVVAIGHGASALNDTCIAIGGNAKTGACGYVSVAIGANANCASPFSIALGKDAHTRGNDENQIAIGTNSSSMTGSSIAIGVLSRAGGSSDTKKDGNACISIGECASSNGDNALAIGSNAIARGSNSIALGYNSNAIAESISIGKNSSSNTFSVVLGSNSSTGSGSVAIGNSSKGRTSSGDITNRSISIGEDAVAQVDYSVAIGANSKASGKRGDLYVWSSVAIGSNAFATSNSVAIGSGANASTLNSVQICGNDVSISAENIKFGNTSLKAIIESIINAHTDASEGGGQSSGRS